MTPPASAQVYFPPVQSWFVAAGLSANGALVAEVLVVVAASLSVFALRHRDRLISAGSIALIGLGVTLDLVAPVFGVAKAIAPFVVILFWWGVVWIVVRAIFRPRGRAHYSTIPRDVVLLLLWVLVVLIVLYLETNIDPTKIFASGVLVSGGIAVALAEPLRNLLTGVTFQITKPFQPGDWVIFQNHLGQVSATSWASTEIVTRAHERVQIPNSMLVSQPIKNFRSHAIADEIEIGISYDDSPGRVKETILQVVRDIPHVKNNPPPQVYAWEYGDYAIKYRVRYYLSDYAVQEVVRDTLVSSLWYALRRRAIDIPYPTQTLLMPGRKARHKEPADFEREVIADLRRVDWLKELPDEELKVLVPSATVHQFGVGEVLVRQGDKADSFYVLRLGKVEVTAQSANGDIRPIATISEESPNPFFGEGLFAEGTRTATVRARSHVEVLEMGGKGFAQLFNTHPGLTEPIAKVVAERLRERIELLKKEEPVDPKVTHWQWLLTRMKLLLDLH